MRTLIIIAFFIAIVLGVTMPVAGRDMFLPQINNGQATSNGTIPQPISTPTPTIEPTTEPVSNLLAVLNNWSSYVDGAGDLEIVGEVVNSSSSNVGIVQMTATLYNEQGVVLANGSGLSMDKVIIPGENSCFRIHFADPPPDNEFTSVNFYGTAVSNPPYEPGLVIFNDSASYDSGFTYYRLTGQVRNDSGKTANNIIVAGTLYSGSDFQGKVIRCHGELLSPSNLDPGQVGAFTLEFSAPVPEAVGSSHLEAQADPPNQ